MVVLTRGVGEEFSIYQLGKKIASVQYVGLDALEKKHRICIRDGNKVQTQGFYRAGEYCFSFGVMAYRDAESQKSRCQFSCYFNPSYLVLRGEVKYKRALPFKVSDYRKDDLLTFNIHQLIRYFGGTKALADQLGVTRTAIYQWHYKGGIPVNRAKKLAALTEGNVILPAAILTGNRGQVKRFADDTRQLSE